MKNTMIVYDIADGRIRHIAAQTFGVPVIESISEILFDSTSGEALFDSTSMDYVVGVTNYDPDDFDTTSGLLTSEAAEKYGVSIAEVAHYIQDLELDIPITPVLDNKIDESTYEITELLQSVETQPSHLVLTIDGVENITPLGTHLPTGLILYSLPDVLPFEDGGGEMTIGIEKQDADGDPMTDAGDNEFVELMVSDGILAGMVNPPFPRVQLVNGAASFTLHVPRKSGLVTISASVYGILPDTPPIIGGTLQFLIAAYDDTE